MTSLRRVAAAILAAGLLALAGQLAPAALAEQAPAPRRAAGQEGWLIKEIVVRGNGRVPAGEVLAAMDQVAVGKLVTAQQIQADLNAIYQEVGAFSDVTADFESLADGVRLVIEVREFPPVSDIRLQAEGVPADAVRGWMQTRVGQPFNVRVLREDLQAIQRRAHEEYGLYVEPARVDFTDNGVVVLELQALRVRGVRVEGNQKTRDHVILRELTFGPGDLLSTREINRSLRRIFQLGFFEEPPVARLAEAEEVRGTDDPQRVDVIIEVKERKTGTASFGAGYSSRDGLLGYVEVSDSNFLGRGQRVNLRAEFGRRGTSYEAGFYEPYVLGTRNSFGIDIYNRPEVRYDNGASQRVGRTAGGDFTLGRPLGEFTRGSIRFRTKTFYPEVPGYVRSVTRSVAFSVSTDTTDHPFFPREGLRNHFSVEMAGGLLGGDVHFTRYEGQLAHYLPAGSQQTWALRVKYGLITGDPPELEQFRVGGSDDLRGYEQGKFTGDRMLVVNAEYRFPIHKSVQGVVFLDGGRAWEPGQPVDLSDLKRGFGVGVRVDTPIGPIRIEYGIGEGGGRTYFSLGPSF